MVKRLWIGKEYQDQSRSGGLPVRGRSPAGLDGGRRLGKDGKQRFEARSLETAAVLSKHVGLSSVPDSSRIFKALSSS